MGWGFSSDLCGGLLRDSFENTQQRATLSSFERSEGDKLLRCSGPHQIPRAKTGREE